MEEIINCTKSSKNDHDPSQNPKTDANNPSDANKDNLKQIEFLTKYTNLYERASILSNKYIKTDYSQIIDCNDFPQEIKCRKEMILSYNKLLNDHEIKNKFIDYMLSERKRLLKEIEKQNENMVEIENATKDEMKHWMELTDRFVTSLDSFKLKCCYCGIPLHQQSVNSFCELNTNNTDNEQETNENINKFNLSTVEEERQQGFGTKGSGLHYFVPFNCN